MFHRWKLVRDAMRTSSSVGKSGRGPWCANGRMCRTCRNLEGGREWRQQIVERFSVPEVDWVCPRGHDWGYEPPARETAKQEPDPPYVAERRATCDVCDVPPDGCGVKHRRDVLGKRCWFGIYIKQPGADCPRGKWPANEGG